MIENFPLELVDFICNKLSVKISRRAFYTEDQTNILYILNKKKICDNY